MKEYRISEKQKKELIQEITGFLQEKNAIIFSYVHGSFLQECFHDIDIALFIDPNEYSKTRYLRKEIELEVEMQKLFGFPFDIRFLNSTPLSFCYSVIKKGHLLFSRDEQERTDFESRIFVKYFDFSFYRKRYMRDALGIHI